VTKQELDIWRAVTNFTKGQEGANLKARELYEQLKTNNMENKDAVVIEEKIFSFGEILVGIEFNPSNDEKVFQVKQKFAEIANLLKDEYNNSAKSPVKSLVFDHAIGEILNAQMSVVKLITMK
jgi:hypothetical protein